MDCLNLIESKITIPVIITKPIKHKINIMNIFKAYEIQILKNLKQLN